MAALLSDIVRWFDQGVAEGATHMIVKLDDFDMDDYPVYVRPDQDVREVEAEHSDPTMEVYILDPERRAEQLRPGTRVRNYT